MLLQDKVAVIYGAGGAIGGAVARAFAAEGARVFRTGRSAAEDVAVVDALDEPAIERHLLQVVDQAGRVDISFNAIGLPDAEIIGPPLLELDAERFARPVVAYTTSYFLTARLAARHMVRQGSGVIMTVTALPARSGTRLNGGYGAKAGALGITWEQFQGHLASTTHPRRVMAVAEVAGVAAFVASDRASGLTGTTVNLTMGSLDD